MNKISRRDFLAKTATAAGLLVLSSNFAFAGTEPHKIASGTDIVALGKSGLKCSVLGIGTGTKGGSEQIAVGQYEFAKMIRHGLDRGITYIDTADGYRTHLFVQLALDGVPRDKYFIQTKSGAKHPEVLKADVNRFLKDLKVKYIDSLLLHAMRTKGWPADMRPVIDELLEIKKSGKVRAVGVSCHEMDGLTGTLDCDWMDTLLVRINPFGLKMDGAPEEVVPVIKKKHDNGCGVIGMKIYGEGLCDTPEKRYESLKYVLGLGCVDAFTIGFSRTEQIDDTLDMIEKACKAK